MVVIDHLRDGVCKPVFHYMLVLDKSPLTPKRAKAPTFAFSVNTKANIFSDFEYVPWSMVGMMFFGTECSVLIPEE